jgi:hypothetical protein
LHSKSNLCKHILATQVTLAILTVLYRRSVGGQIPQPEKRQQCHNPYRKFKIH